MTIDLWHVCLALSLIAAIVVVVLAHWADNDHRL